VITRFRCALFAFLFGALSAISAFLHEGVPLAHYSSALPLDLAHSAAALAVVDHF
jgi:hypothetical protein